MEDLARLAQLINQRNLVEQGITALIGRPAELGHIGEYVAAKVFNIALEQSASHKSIDGRFEGEPLDGRTVNIKWYALREDLLDITSESLPDYYLVLTGPKALSLSSRGHVRPWTIERVFLFRAEALVPELARAGVHIGIATSVKTDLWQRAGIFPAYRDDLFPLSKVQRASLLLFGPLMSGN